MTALLTLGLIACTSITGSADSGTTSPSGPGTSTDSGTSSGTETALECPPADTAGDGTITLECCDSVPSLQILGGEGEPLDMEPGSDLPISYSPQYGWEFQLFPKLCGTRDVITLQVLLTDTETGSLLQDATETIALFPDAPESCCQDGWVRYERLNVQGIPDSEGREWAATLCGRDVQVTLTGTDWDGREASETLDLVFSADPEALGHACGE